MMLMFIKHVYRNDVATELANSMDYERHQDLDWDTFTKIFIITQP